MKEALIELEESIANAYIDSLFELTPELLEFWTQIAILTREEFEVL